MTALFTAQTIGRNFELDLGSLAENIQNNYGLHLLEPLGAALKGDVNVNFKLETDQGQKIIRLYGSFNQYTKKELEVMQYLVGKGFPTSQPLHNSQGELISRYNDYEYSIFDFIVGEQPKYTPEAFYRVGKAVGRMQKLLKDCPIKIDRENHSLQIFRRKAELTDFIQDNMALIKELLEPGVFATIKPQLDLFQEASVPDQEFQLIHGDIYSPNVIDNGNEAAIIDFEYVANGPAVIDLLLYPSWDGICNSRTQNTPEVYRPKPYVLVDQLRAYFAGYKETNTMPDIDAKQVRSVMILLQVGDTVFNLEKAIKARQNLFNDYTNNFNSSTATAKNWAAIRDLLAEI